MTTKLHFHPLGQYIYSSITPEQTDRLIRNFKAFLTAPAVSAAMHAYSRMPLHSDGIQAIRLRERQPLIEALMLFERLTFGGRRKLKRRIPVELSMLAHVAALAQVIIPTLDASSVAQQRDALLCLNGRLKPLLLEWKSAAQLARMHPTEVAWLPSGHVKAAEFVARINGIEFDVECKRLTSMVTQRLGGAEANALADQVMQHTQNSQLQGSLILEIPDNVINPRGGLTEPLGDILVAHLHPGDIDISFPNGVRLHGALRPWTQTLKHWKRWAAEFHQQNDGIPNARAYSRGAAEGEYVRDPLTMVMASPTKSPEEILETLWIKKFQKAAEQCSGERGAILVFEWESITDPTIFADPGVFQHLMRRTFEQFPYVARVVMRCDTPPEHAFGMVGYNAWAYTVENEHTSYPDVRQFMPIEVSP